MHRFVPLLLAATAIGLMGLGTTAPATAASVASCMSQKILGADGLWHEKVEVFADSIAIALRRQGYDVERVEPWAGCVRAFVRQPDGGTRMQFFDPDTLAPLTTN